jgi:signal transduction histidine kinase
MDHKPSDWNQLDLSPREDRLKSMGIFGKFRRWWSNLSLAKQFATLAIAALLPCSAFAGNWIAGQTHESVVRNTAATAALYMDGLVEPLVSEIETSGTLSTESREKLDKLLASSTADYKIVSMKIWMLDGTIIYSTFKDMIGKKFPASESFVKATQGELGAEFENEPHEEDALERATGIPLLEIYAPVRDKLGRKIVAVSEFYANGENIEKDLARAALTSWAIVAAAAAAVVAFLSSIVARGSQTINAQRNQLASQVQDLEQLRDNLRMANENVANSNEQILQRIGADLHDGPAQQLAYALLRLSKIRSQLKEAKKDDASVENLRLVLTDTLRDVRNLSSRLQKPELSVLEIADVIQLAMRVHSDYTRSEVTFESKPHPIEVTQDVKMCAYRFVQEALTNAYKHAAGTEQKVVLSGDDRVVITVTDGGTGFKPTSEVNRPNREAGLGLRGMRSRVEALGGTLLVTNHEGGGALLRASFLPYKASERGDPQ